MQWFEGKFYLFMFIWHIAIFLNIGYVSTEMIKWEKHLTQQLYLIYLAY